ncbi:MULTISPECIES: enoyl-CoA hydratase/isomerase family protein [unclassified Spirosoma]|uniref:enoyl-CoA hydratase/isomerase family protein n=1 Tax=unclassified Spirosoma TaxID=2621999 RepID=UPI000964669A|nr:MULTISPECIES: enoyl-CoA hydratase/isomerase family protein [unclassified Spirosoma]MBN8822651.1 enoyl-CoA hydratase/isomerase family protein [Spirosoma sp.]OJW74140.1 MAG: enoyl-CoA hydratase [Spirosoma sp. 48-14]
MIFTTNKVSDAYWKVIINNPPINLFDAEFSRQLAVLMDELEASEDLKVVVFETANPDFFVAHIELLHAADFPKGIGKTGLPVAWPDLAKRLEQAPFVSIASIRGRARAIGSEFVQAFDIRFASKEKTILSQPEIGIGSFPGGGGLERLHLLTGKARALEIILSGDDYDAETAALYGWINRAIPDNELDSFVDNFAKRIASFDRQAIVSVKSIMNQRAPLPQNEHILDTQQRFFAALGWQESQERVKSLFGKGLQQYSDVELNLGRYL